MHAEQLQRLVGIVAVVVGGERPIEQCIAYLSTRVQFGVALSTFQVLRHKVVEMYVDYESASVLLARLVAEGKTFTGQA